MKAPNSRDATTIGGTLTNATRPRRQLIATIAAVVSTTWSSERTNTLTLSSTWSPTFWQSALSRDEISPVLVTSKKPSSARSSASRRRWRRRVEKRAPRTVNVAPRTPVARPVTAAVSTSCSIGRRNAAGSAERAISFKISPYRYGMSDSPTAATVRPQKACTKNGQSGAHSASTSDMRVRRAGAPAAASRTGRSAGSSARAQSALCSSRQSADEKPMAAQKYASRERSAASAGGPTTSRARHLATM